MGALRSSNPEERIWRVRFFEDRELFENSGEFFKDGGGSSKIVGSSKIGGSSKIVVYTISRPRRSKILPHLLSSGPEDRKKSKLRSSEPKIKKLPSSFLEAKIGSKNAIGPVVIEEPPHPRL